MAKMVFGFFLGAIVAAAATALMLTRPQDVALPLDAKSIAPEVKTIDPEPFSAQNQRSRDVAPADAVRAEPEPIPAAESAESREARLIVELEDARRTVDETSAELEELRIAKQLRELPVVFPLPLPSNFAWVLEEPTGKLLHGLIQRENRDETWAPATERELQRFLYDQAEVVNELGAPTINCRTARCEVTFVGYGADERSLEVAEKLRDDFGQHDLQDRFSLSIFTQGSFWVGEHYEDGVVTVFWSLPRRED